MTLLPLTHVRRDRGGAGGFLLAETLATFTISALVLLGLVSASSVLLRAVDRDVLKIQDVDDLSRTLNAIARDVSGMTRARWNGAEPQSFVFRGGPSSLDFATIQRDSDWPDQTRVISLREIVVAKGTRLMRSEARLSGRASGFAALQYSTPRELGIGLARLRFYYVPLFVGKSKESQLRTWPFGSMLPTAIIIKAVARDTGKTIVSMRVPIRVNADIGCLDQESEQATSMPRAAPVPAPTGFCGRPNIDRTHEDKRTALPETVPQAKTGSTL